MKKAAQSRMANHRYAVTMGQFFDRGFQFGFEQGLANGKNGKADGKDQHHPKKSVKPLFAQRVERAAHGHNGEKTR